MTGDLSLPSDGHMSIAKEPVTVTDILISSLHRQPEFGVDTEIEHISTPPAQRQGAGDLLLDLSSLRSVVQKTLSCPSRSHSGVRNREAAFTWSCVSANTVQLRCTVAGWPYVPDSTVYAGSFGDLDFLKCFRFAVFT